MVDLSTGLSLLLNAIGTLVAVLGAIYNAIGNHKFALWLWIVSNATLLILFVGVAMGWFILNSGAWMQVCLYAVFCCTSCYGYWRIVQKEQGDRK